MTPLKPEHKLTKALALHPDVQPYIISLHPHDLERLNNPFIQQLLPPRITLARLAVMLDMSAESLIAGIYEAAGMEEYPPISPAPLLPANPAQPPNWFTGEVVTVIDLLEGDERLDVDPFVPLFPAIKQLEVGEVLLLKHKWHPQPLYDVFQKLEVTHYAIQKSPAEWWIYLRKGRDSYRVKK